MHTMDMQLARFVVTLCLSLTMDNHFLLQNHRHFHNRLIVGYIAYIFMYINSAFMGDNENNLDTDGTMAVPVLSKFIKLLIIYISYIR